MGERRGEEVRGCTNRIGQEFRGRPRAVVGIYGPLARPIARGVIRSGVHVKQPCVVPGARFTAEH
jgi:hypothetical protein